MSDDMEKVYDDRSYGSDIANEGDWEASEVDFWASFNTERRADLTEESLREVNWA
jgi:hypothetical protein